MPNVTIAVDIAKNVFEIAVSASAGRITERRRRRGKAVDKHVPP